MDGRRDASAKGFSKESDLFGYLHAEKYLIVREQPNKGCLLVK